MEPQELLAKYFSENATKKEREEVDVWKNDSVENAEEFQAFKEAWKISNSDRFNIQNGWDKFLEKSDFQDEKPIQIPLTENSNSSPNYMKIAAAISFLFVSTFLIYHYFSASDLFNDHAQISGIVISETEKDVFLLDGSKLFLAPSGMLTYASDFEKDKERRVELSGQAFFDISKDKSKPFIIETNHAKIEVTGTSFVVKESDGFTEVQVASGSVKVMRNGGTSFITLEKGEMGVVPDDGGDLIKRNNTDINYLSWMTGSFNFKKMKLNDVFELIENKYNVEIEVSNHQIFDCEYTATFESRTADEIIEIIAKSFDLNFKETSKGKFMVEGVGC